MERSDREAFGPKPKGPNPSNPIPKGSVSQASNAPKEKKPAFVPTIGPTYSLADRLLAGHERTFTVKFNGKLYPLWKLVERLAHVTNKDDEDVVFKYNRQQCQRYLEKCRLKEAGRSVRTNTLKARQIGITTQEAVEMTVEGLFTPNTQCVIVADTVEHAAGIFDKVQYVYDHLDMANPYRSLIEADPKTYGRYSYKPSLKFNKGQKMLQTRAGNSRIEVVAVSDAAGRSRHYTRMHCSECAFWPGMEKAMLSLFKTVSRGNPRSQISLETTANGYNDYKSRWDRDFAGRSTFKAVFLPWHENPDYRAPIPAGYDLLADMDQWEIDKMRRHGLTLEQMHWFHLEYLDCNRKKDLILQEDPFDPVDAFISTGNSVFDKDLLAERKRQIVAETETSVYPRGRFHCRHVPNEDMSVIDVPEGSIRWAESREGPIRIFKEPEEGHPYVVTCDPFMGGSDDVAMQVVDNHTGRQVARFKSNELTNEQCAWQLYCLGRHYNWALVSSETNVGRIVMDLLVKAKYPKLYVTQETVTENFRRSVKTRFGHRITKSNRQLAIESLVTAFSEDPTVVADYDTLCEMESFQLVERFDRDGNVTSAKQEAAGGAHDDLVMALAAFYLVRNQQTAMVSERGPNGPKAGQSFAEIEAAYYENKARKAAQEADAGGTGFSW